MNATIAASRVMKLATGAKSEYVQLEASRDLLDRAGIRAPERIQHDVQGEIKINIDLT